MRKSIVCLILVMVLMLTSLGTVVLADQPDKAYTYDENQAVPSTNPYQVKLIVNETVMGTTRMNDPRDVFVDKQDRIFILDSGNGRVLILDDQYHCIQELKDFTYNGEAVTLAPGAQGLFFRDANQLLYIADTENDRIIVSDLNGAVKNIYTKPVGELLDPAIPYRPQKIVVDNMGIMYVKSGNINTGALLVDSNNSFLGFFGTNEIKQTAEVLAEYLWRSILNKEQNAQSSMSFQPVEFNNLFWSEDRFVYAVSPVNEQVKATVVKLNALGKNVFEQDIDFYQYEVNRNEFGFQLADITVDDEGVVTVLEMQSGSLFQYDEACNLLAIFGGIGNQDGLFTLPSALESDSKNNLLVLDATKCTLTVLEQTYYGEMIRSANNLYNQGRHQESIELWMEVIRMNSNYTQAYTGLGKAYMSLGEYEAAKEYFKIGKDKDGYSDAEAKIRDGVIRDNFAILAAVIVVFMICFLGSDQLKRLTYKISDLFRRK